MNTGVVGEFATALFVVAVIYLLVRPRSGAVEMVTEFSKALAGLVSTATHL